MHQYPRGSPVTASPANSPRTNPTRTNNSRDHEQGRPRSNQDAMAGGDRSSTEGLDIGLQNQQPSNQSKEAKAKLSQIVQVRYVRVTETMPLADTDAAATRTTTPKRL